MKVGWGYNLATFMVRRLVCLFALGVAAAVDATASSGVWTEIASPHFTVVSDCGERNAGEVLDQFERMRWVFHALFPKFSFDPAQPILILLTKDDKVFKGLEPAAYQAKGHLKPGGVFIKALDRNYVLLRLNEAQEHPFASVYHEYTHIQFTFDGESIPLWLNEGLAEFLQNTEIRKKDVLLGSPSEESMRYLRKSAIIPLPVLFKVDQESPYYHEERKGSIFYAESWALTHYLEITDLERGTHRLNDYLALVSAHEDSLASAEKAFGDLKRLEGELGLYVRMGNYRQYALAGVTVEMDRPARAAHTLSQPKVNCIHASFLAAAKRTDEARMLLAGVLEADPGNVFANETMGHVELQTGDREQARKWYARAVQLGSQDFIVHYYFGALTPASSSPPDNMAAEASLRAAIRLNPIFAPAFDRLAYLMAKRDAKSKEAYLMNLHAIELDPGNLGYRLNAAGLLSFQGRFFDATAVLVAAQQVANGPEEAATVQKRIDEVRGFASAKTLPEAGASGW